MTIKDKSVPIYKQIMTDIEYDISSNKLQVGQKLKSIRDLAIEYKVNPNTMARALSELENMGLIYTDRTNGKYVVEDKKILEESKNKLIKRDTLMFIDSVKKMNLDKDYVKELIDLLWEVEA